MIYTVVITNGQYDYVAQLEAETAGAAMTEALLECATEWKHPSSTLQVRAVMSGEVRVIMWCDPEDLFPARRVWDELSGKPRSNAGCR